MIVDLVRNDLGRICQMGSVTVPELWRVDRFPTVHQMTSLVRGELREDVSLFDIFAALFPPGSVTGAPKIRAMQIISEVEAEPRSIYCGTIGLFFPNGDFECNVAIRTIQRMKAEGGRMKSNEAPPLHPSSFILHPSLLGLGSGIVADSDPETEWRETQLKGEFVTLQPRDFILYETIRYDQRMKAEDSSLLDLHLHLRRLRQSCLYFGHPFPLHEIIEHLRELQTTLGDVPARIKLDLKIDPFSSFKFQVSSFSDSSLIPHPSSLIETHVIRENLSWPTDGMTVMLSDLRLDPEDFRLYHKTNLRPEKYEELEKARALGATEVLFLNTRGELCEGALSNLALKINGEWRTPALHCGLLPGTWREKQLASGRLREAVLTLDDLRRAEEIRMGNAVRGEGKVIRVINSKGDNA
jgi:para-aminobenzoate synthetase/4-amino-4-deoxychorismate lyase